MAASLQSRIQLLAVLAVLFTLVSVPLFYQVRADAADSKETAKNTFLSKFFADVARDLKADRPDDLIVEDAWGEWQQKNPDCGPACDPEADPDGDGVSNRDEVEQGRNPACNEEREGTEYCEGRSPQLPPPGNTTEPLEDVLFQGTFTPDQTTDSFTVKDIIPNYDRWEIEWSVTNFQGFGTYRFRILDEDRNPTDCCRTGQVNFPVQDQHEDSQTLDGENLPPSGATYEVVLETNAFQGTWQFVVVGVRDGATA